jgi:hypothetical protein
MMMLDERTPPPARGSTTAFPRTQLRGLNVTQTGPHRWTFTDRATGAEYRRVACDPLLAGGQLGIVAFTVDAGGNLHFLRQRGAPAGRTDRPGRANRPLRSSCARR